jgi:co-chaperonin GroES (HSP10)
MSGKQAKKKKRAVHPRHGWVIVKKLSLETVVTDAGVFVDRSQAKTYQAEVIEASDVIRNGETVPSDLLPGDLVIITAFSQTFEDLEEITGDKDLLMVRDEEVYAHFDKL